jgi:hypothetical protein
MTKVCLYAKSHMTPCVIRDGAVAFAMDSQDRPICVGCERSPKTLGVPYPANWAKTVADYKQQYERKQRGH